MGAALPYGGFTGASPHKCSLSGLSSGILYDGGP